VCVSVDVLILWCVCVLVSLCMRVACMRLCAREHAAMCAHVDGSLLSSMGGGRVITIVKPKSVRALLPCC
jgi:hypothetical protein